MKRGEYSHRAYVGIEEKYDLIGAHQFCNLISVGLRECHKLLDIGCGSLRLGKFAIPYLKNGNYFGIEPNQWLIEEAIKHETGSEIIAMKNPTFRNNDDFDLSVFGEKFDYLIAQSIFSHASQAQILTCCKKAYEVMNDKSIFIATFIKGIKNYEGDTWINENGVRYTANFIKSLIESAGLKCKLVPEWNHPNGQTWIRICK